jgi:hypothetical protein
MDKIIKLGIVLLVCATIIWYFFYTKKEHLDALKAINDLKLNKQAVEEVSPEFLLENQNNVDIAMIPTPNVEHMTFSQPLNTSNWPYYNYSQPYQYKTGGAWPPNMFSRLYNWQPGYNTAGWSFWLRPGMTYDKWQRNRWVKQNGNFYYINNGTDRTNDFNGEPS